MEEIRISRMQTRKLNIAADGKYIKLTNQKINHVKEK